MSTPRVTVGMPVYNGERFVAEAITSVLAQTFMDFELIICDNASTDSTGEICRRYAAQDERIRYYRSDRNRGAAANFNRTFALARSEYFKWAAHDDLLAPDYLEKCVASLDADPEAVLCQPLVNEVDEKGETREIFDSRLLGTTSSRPADRFAPLVLERDICKEIFGLIRKDALSRTSLHADYAGQDRALLAELSLLGRFIKLPEPLFIHRDHPDRSIWTTIARDDRILTPYHPDRIMEWYNPDKVGERVWHRWRLYRDYFRMVRRHVADRMERARCYGHLVRYLCVSTNLRDLVVEAASAVDRRPFLAARAMKRRLLRQQRSLSER